MAQAFSLKSRPPPLWTRKRRSPGRVTRRGCSPSFNHVGREVHRPGLAVLGVGNKGERFVEPDIVASNQVCGFAVNFFQLHLTAWCSGIDVIAPVRRQRAALMTTWTAEKFENRGWVSMGVLRMRKKENELFRTAYYCE
jgi:hypothetical protein